MITAGSLSAYVNVLFTVGPGSAGGSFITDPTSLTFLDLSGSAILPSQTITVMNAPGATGSVAYTAYATSLGNWLTVAPSVGSTRGTLTVGAIQFGVPTGIYTGTVTIVPATF